ncbi:terpene cyclase [Burkholderia pseudomallei]|nr:terpene cyclase [Burkholderia pseudomallei]
MLEAIADLSIWFFVWDDRHDEDARRLRRAAWARLRDALCAVLASPHARVADAEPIVGALADCIVRIHARLGDAWNRRFTGHLRQVIDAYDDEFRARLAARIPTRCAPRRRIGSPAARRSNSPRFTTISVRCARSAKPEKSTISAFR